jgi:hypothetical protein
MTIGDTNPTDRGIDALVPADIAEKAETVGVQKTKLDVLSFLRAQLREPRGSDRDCIAASAR